MRSLRIARESRRLSQRFVAKKAGLSFRGYQLLESDGHDPRLSSLDRAAGAIGLPPGAVRHLVGRLLLLDPDSAAATGLRILLEGDETWTVHIFDFVDAFRRSPSEKLVVEPPPPGLPERVGALLASTVEALCAEAGLALPHWVRAVPPLAVPWFPSGVENLKAMALVEAPVEFRRRQVFVLGNFLARA
jgi:transcriptional regulator with XRE-family HTH domain